MTNDLQEYLTYHPTAVISINIVMLLFIICGLPLHCAACSPLDGTESKFGILCHKYGYFGTMIFLAGLVICMLLVINGFK